MNKIILHQRVVIPLLDLYTAQPIDEEEGDAHEDEESTSTNNTTASTTNTSVENTTDSIPLTIHGASDAASNDLIAVYENVSPGLFDNVDCDDENEDDAGPLPEKKTGRKKGHHSWKRKKKSNRKG